MSTYETSKKELDKIRNEFGCQGELIFRTSLQYVVEFGQERFQREQWVKERLDIIDANHDKAEQEGKVLWIERNFEKAFIECAAAIASTCNAYDLLLYVQKEIWLGGDGIDYQRAIQLLKRCIGWEIGDTYELSFALEEVREMGFTDDEIVELGFEYMLDCVEKVDEWEE